MDNIWYTYLLLFSRSLKRENVLDWGGLQEGHGKKRTGYKKFRKSLPETPC